MKYLLLIAMVVACGCNTVNGDDMALIEAQCIERAELNMEITRMIQELEADGVIIRDVIK
jgi:hypothetical protein